MKNHLPSNFLLSLTTGSVSIKSGSDPIMKFTAKNNSKTVEIFEIPIKISGKPGLLKQLSEARELAKQLKKEDTTLEIKFKGETILKLGKEANPKLAKIVTLSGDIEITDINQFKKLMSAF